MRVEQFPRPGKENLLAYPVKKSFAEFVFERPDLLADRRLGEKEFLSRAANAPSLGDLLEVG